MIILFDETARTFETLGVKVLKPLVAVVKKEDNGEYTLEYRDHAENYHLFKNDMIIAVDTPWGRQAFRVNNPKLNGSKFDIKAQHVFYDSKNYLIKDSYVVDNNASYALGHLNAATDVTSPFSTISDVVGNFSLRTVRKSLYEAVLAVAERWGGHLIFDNFNVELRKEIGQDRGVTVAYGKNIRGFTITEKWDNVVTKVLPVGKDGLLLEDTYVELAVDDYDTPYSRVVSFKQDHITDDSFKNEQGVVDTEAYKTALRADLLSQAQKYLSDNHLPKVNYSVEAFVEGIVDLGDIVRVNHPRLKDPLETRVIGIEYDAISERIDKVEFGNFNDKLQNLISDTVKTIETATEETKTEVTTAFERSLQNATANIAGIMTNSNVIYDGDQILVVDNLPKETATNVMRINASGIGFSTSGINGEFNSAWQINGTMDMQQINAINLVADKIKGGTLRLGFFEGNNGLIEILDEYGNYTGRIDQNGIVFTNPNGDRLELNPIDGLSAFSSLGGTEQEVFSIDRDVTNIAKLHARDQIEMPPIKIVPISSGSQAGWAFVKLNGGTQ